MNSWKTALLEDLGYLELSPNELNEGKFRKLSPNKENLSESVDTRFRMLQHIQQGKEKLNLEKMKKTDILNGIITQINKVGPILKQNGYFTKWLTSSEPLKKHITHIEHIIKSQDRIIKKDPMMINWSIEKLEDIVGTYRSLYSAYLKGDEHYSFIRGGEAHALTIVCCADYLLNILKNIKL